MTRRGCRSNAVPPVGAPPPPRRWNDVWRSSGDQRHIASSGGSSHVSPFAAGSGVRDTRRSLPNVRVLADNRSVSVDQITAAAASTATARRRPEITAEGAEDAEGQTGFFLCVLSVLGGEFP